MAETEAPETLAKPEETEAPTQEMDIEAQADDTAAGDDGLVKRAREEADADENGDEEAKKQKVEKSVEEQRLQKSDKEEEEEKKLDSVPDPEQAKVAIGPKSFGSSVEMFDYFYKFLHTWTPNVNVNKYEHVMLLELLKRGHPEPDRKLGTGVHAFQIRFHPQFKSRCFFVIREDESVDDFSFRKCVNHILPLPENMQVKADVNKTLGRGRGGGGRGGRRGHGRGRGGRPKN